MEINYCIDCGKEICKIAKRCKKCSTSGIHDIIMNFQNKI